MSDVITATHQYLLTHFGPLLTLKHLAGDAQHAQWTAYGDAPEKGAVYRGAGRNPAADGSAPLLRSAPGGGGDRSESRAT